MASTTALFTGLSGLTANARNLDVIGNNIANSNTTAFKSNRMLFASQFSRTFSIGTVPSTNTGGSNPGQVGLGVGIAGTQRDFSGGALSTTGDARDLAIEGNGFFIVNRGGTPFYTRAGSFRQNSTNDLVSISGERVQGYSVDKNFNVVPTLTNLNIPVGTLTFAEATRNVRFAGNLNAGGSLPTQGSRFTLGALALLGGPVGADVMPPDSLATEIENPDPANVGQPLFTAGQKLVIDGAQRGTKTLPTASLDITAATTVQDVMDFLGSALGISTGGSPNPDGRAPGISLDPATGVMTIDGNTGAVNDFELRAGDFVVKNADGTDAGSAFSFTKDNAADGESVRNTFAAYDSLGARVDVDLTMVLESRQGGNGTTWRYFADSGDAAGVPTALNTGTVNFDNNGRLLGPGGFGVRIDRTGSGAASPLDFTVQLASGSGSVTALATGSALAETDQDGAPRGTLASYSVGTDGIITGAFDNGLTRTVGQVALATFANPEGLVDVGSNLFTNGPNSGTPIVGEPLSLGAGRVVGGALELSNVDLSQEFINLILASTGYSASSRVITTTDQLMQQLLVLGR